jgi:Tol biopolymer transport system component
VGVPLALAALGLAVVPQLVGRSHLTPRPAPVSTPTAHANGAIMLPLAAQGPAGTSDACQVAAIDATTGRVTARGGSLVSCFSTFTWSPDGTSSAGLIWHTGAASDVVVTSPTESAPRTVVKGCRCRSLSWSPDGRSLAASEGRDVLLVDVATARTRRLQTADGDVGEIDWSPDGTTLVLSISFCPTGHQCTTTDDTASFASSRLDLLDVRSGQQRSLVRSDQVGVLLTSPRWSPDGALIAYGEQHAAGNPKASAWLLGIMTVAPRTHRISTLHSNSQPCLLCFSVVAWSPDAHSLAVSTRSGAGDSQGLFVVDPDGTGWHRLADISSAAWLWWRAAP